jgi:glycyl-tRNA synthetase (class II)
MDKVKNEMLIYEVDNKTVIDIHHLVEAQVQTINLQAKIIKMLEAQITQNKLDAKQELQEHIAHQSGSCWECGQSI